MAGRSATTGVSRRHALRPADALAVAVRDVRSEGGEWQSSLRAQLGLQTLHIRDLTASAGSKQEADMKFPDPPVAMMGICSITRRDFDRRGQRGHVETSAPGGRIVTAGDGNMVTVVHIGHPRQGSE